MGTRRFLDSKLKAKLCQLLLKVRCQPEKGLFGAGEGGAGERCYFKRSGCINKLCWQYVFSKCHLWSYKTSLL